MEFLSIFASVDSLRKLLVVLGLVFLIGGFLYPFQKKIDLENLKVHFLEQSRIDSLELSYINKEVNEIDSITVTHKDKVINLRKTQEKCDSLQTKFKEIEKTIERFKEEDLDLIEKQKSNLFKFEIRQIKLDSISLSIENTDRFINNYYYIQWFIILLGFILLALGLKRLNISEKQSISIIGTEIEIKKLELEKLKQELSKIK